MSKKEKTMDVKMQEAGGIIINAMRSDEYGEESDRLYQDTIKQVVSLFTQEELETLAFSYINKMIYDAMDKFIDNNGPMPVSEGEIIN